MSCLPWQSTPHAEPVDEAAEDEGVDVEEPWVCCAAVDGKCRASDPGWPRERWRRAKLDDPNGKWKAGERICGCNGCKEATGHVNKHVGREADKARLQGAARPYALRAYFLPTPKSCRLFSWTFRKFSLALAHTDRKGALG